MGRMPLRRRDPAAESELGSLPNRPPRQSSVNSVQRYGRRSGWCCAAVVRQLF